MIHKIVMYKVIFYTLICLFVLSLVTLWTPLRFEILAIANLSTVDGSYLLYFYLPPVLFASLSIAAAIIAFASNKIKVFTYLSLAGGVWTSILLALCYTLNIIPGLRLIDYFGLTSWSIYFLAPLLLPFGIVTLLVGIVSKAEPKRKLGAALSALLCIITSVTALMTIITPMYSQFVVEQSSAGRRILEREINGKYANYQEVLYEVSSCSIDYVETQKGQEYPDFKYLYIGLRDGKTFFNQREQEIYYNATIKPVPYIYLPLSDSSRLKEAINQSNCAPVKWKD
jgi:hypothetical protein